MAHLLPWAGVSLRHETWPNNRKRFPWNLSTIQSNGDVNYDPKNAVLEMPRPEHSESNWLETGHTSVMQCVE